MDMTSRFLPYDHGLSALGWAILQTERALMFAVKPLADPDLEGLGHIEGKKRNTIIVLRSTPLMHFRQQQALMVELTGQ